MSAFPYSEPKVCDEFGLSPSDAKQIRERHLNKGIDWQDGGRDGVLLSVVGVKRLWRLSETLGPIDLTLCLASKKNGAGTILMGSATSPIPFVVTITQICDNPMVVRAVGEQKQVIMVWVGKNQLFSTGMKIKVVSKTDMPGFYRMAGPLPGRKYSAEEWSRRQRAGLPN